MSAAASIHVARRCIACTVQDAPDLQHSGMHNIEDQVAAEYDAPDAFAQPWR
jgi:hypothetical protein